MPPKRKTGVQNVDIGGAYKLARECDAGQQGEVLPLSEGLDMKQGEQEEDVDAELEALAMECDAEEVNDTDCAARGLPLAQVQQEDTSAEAAADDEDVDAELQALSEAFDTAEAGPPEEPATVPGPAQADGDETDAEDVEQALAALESIVEDEQDLAGSAPPTTAQTQPQAPSGSAKPEIASTAEQQKAVSQDTPKPAETTQEAVSTATTNADITASTPSKAGEGTLGKAVNKKRPPPVPVQRKLSVPAIPAKTSSQSKSVATAKGPSAVADNTTEQLHPTTASPQLASQSPATNPSVATGTPEASQSKESATVPVNSTSATHVPSTKSTTAPAKKSLAMAVKAPAKPLVKTLGTASAKPAAPKTVTATSDSKGEASGASTDAKNSTKGKAGKADAAPKAPRAKNAYMFFLADKRAAVKAETPGASIGDVAKAVAELWKGTTEKDKKPYQDMANADKERVAKLKADMPAVPKQTKAAAAKEAKAAAKETKTNIPRVKTAYLMFCEHKRAEIKAANPEAGFGETGKLLAAAWKACDADTKARFQEQSQFEKIKLQATAAAETLASVKHQRPATIGKATAVKANAVAEQNGAAPATPESAVSESANVPQTDADMAAEDRTSDEPQSADGSAAIEEQQPTHVTEDADTDDEADREGADFVKHPAEAIIGHTFHNKYMVKRKGLDFTEYGLVDARAVKRQRLGGDSSAAKLPVTVEMMDEYENFCKAFRRSVHEHHDQGSLDLDDIGQGSPLEMCYYLGKLQEDNYLLSKAPKKKGEVDVMIKVPMLGLSMVTQRLLNTERLLRVKAETAAAAKAEEVDRLKGELTVLQMVAQAAQKQQAVAVMEEE